EPDRFLWRKRCRVIKRRNRHIDRFWIFTVLDKQVRAATRGKRANPTRMGNFARLTSCHTQIFAGHGSPGDIGRASASPAIYAMTIVQRKRSALQHVSCSA